MVTLTIDGEQVTVPENTTIMDAAKQVNIRIPSLCYLQGLIPHGACGVCVVEVEGERTITRSCVRLVQEGMKVHTNTSAIRNIREALVELLLSNHPAECFICERGETCELKDLASTLGVKEIRFDTKKPEFALDTTSVSIIRNPNKCILCGRCIRVCGGVQTVEAIDFVNRGDSLMVAPGLEPEPRGKHLR